MQNPNGGYAPHRDESGISGHCRPRARPIGASPVSGESGARSPGELPYALRLAQRVTRMLRLCYARKGAGVGVNGMTPTTTWTRIARRLGLDHNPLRRRSDVVEGWLLPVTIVTFLLLGPLVAGLVGLRMQADNAAAHRAEQSWHRVPAVLLKAAPGPMMSDNGANTWLVWTPASWAANGRSRTGIVPAPSGTKAGSTVRVWVDQTGTVRVPPLNAARAADRIAIAMGFALAALAVFLTGLALVTRSVLDHRRLADWETAWLSVGPDWSRHQ